MSGTDMFYRSRLDLMIVIYSYLKIIVNDWFKRSEFNSIPSDSAGIDDFDT